MLVSYVESYSFTSISCDSGWTETLDVANSDGARLAACVAVATVNQAEPQARINPATQVSMVTEAFSGVSNSDPVNASAAQARDRLAERDHKQTRHDARPRRGKQRMEARD